MALIDLKKLALRPLVHEASESASRRKLRLLFGLPFAALAGIAWGVSAAPAMAAGSALSWSLIGAAALATFIYLEQRVVPPLAESLVSTRKLGGRWGAVAFETMAIGGLIFLLTRLLGVPEAPGVELALVFGAFYATTMELLLVGVPGGLASLLGMGGGGPARRTEDHSRIDALIARGAWAAAIEECRSAIAEHPGTAEPYLLLFRVLVAKKDYRGAVDALEWCWRRASLGREQEEFVVRQIADVSAGRLADPERAAYAISDWLDRRPDEPVPEWAEKTLDDLAESTQEEAREGADRGGPG